MRDIIERLEKATGPDRELDRLIHFHCVHPWLAEKAVKWVPAAFEPEGEFLWWSAEQLASGKEGFSDAWEPLTASLDAVLALVEAKLPGKNWLLGKGRVTPKEPLYGAQLLDGEIIAAEGEHDTSPAIALLLALFRALEGAKDV